jgi:hypothetical protein
LPATFAAGGGLEDRLAYPFEAVQFVRFAQILRLDFLDC